METTKTQNKKNKSKKVKDFLNHRPRKLNPNLFVDDSQENYAYDELVKIHKSEINRMGQVLHAKLKLHENHLSLVPRGDLHYSTANPKLINRINDYISNTNTFFVDGGDMLQGAKEGHHTGEAQESRMTPQEEAELFAKSLDGIAHKCLGAVPGNHDDPELADRYKDSFTSLLRLIYKLKGVPYARTILVEAEMPVIEGRRVVGTTSAMIAFTHNNGRGSTKKITSAEKTYNTVMGDVAKYNRKNRTNFIPHVILGFHYHTNADLEKTFEADIYDKYGMVTGSYVQPIHVRCSSTLQDANSSSFTRGFSDHIINTYNQLDMHFEVNKKFDPYGINKQPKYVMVLNEFPILDKYGEYTTPAKEYMENRKDYSSEYYKHSKNKYEKTKLSEMAKIVEENIDSLLK